MVPEAGQPEEARSSHEKALALAQQEAERQFLKERIRQLKEEEMVGVQVIEQQHSP